MTRILLYTPIHAPVERCFDLSRSIDLHRFSMSTTREEAIAGKTHGLIELGESVTWRATHFLVRQELSSKITAMERPHYFIDEMQKGAFRSMWHHHSFTSQNGITLMYDEFRYEVPYGIAGRLFDRLVLHRYMTRLLESRNAEIKAAAESGEWQRFVTA